MSIGADERYAVVRLIALSAVIGGRFGIVGSSAGASGTARSFGAALWNGGGVHDILMSAARGMVMRVSASLIILGSVVLAGTSAHPDRERGRDVFRTHCVGCHAIDCNRQGPMLRGVMGRKAASVPDFSGYSAAMKASGILWTEETLTEFLTDPRGLVPGTGMSVVGKLDADADRRDLIEFLRDPDTSLDLCF